MSTHVFTELLRSDMTPSFGVTEPGAIALAVSRARSFTEGEIKSIELSVNSGIYKNSFTCGIPGTDEIGIPFAAALGAVAGDWTKGLEALGKASQLDLARAQVLLDAGKVHVELHEISSALYINARVSAGSHTAEVTITGTHTNISSIFFDGESLIRHEAAADEAPEPAAESVTGHSFAEMWEYAAEIPREEIDFIENAYKLNLALAEKGQFSDKCTICKELITQNGGMYSQDYLKTAHALTAAAIEARVRGLPCPAMSITGSGNHGIIATLPLYACYKVKGTDWETLLRATALSYLVTEYIKEYSGKLSAFCGCAVAAGTGSAVGLCYMLGGGRSAAEAVIRNMASGITGIICTGGNPACVMKAAAAIDIGCKSVELALSSVSIEPMHGINGFSVEDTMRNIGRIASPGMEKTEETILALMTEKTGRLPQR